MENCPFVTCWSHFLKITCMGSHGSNWSQCEKKSRCMKFLLHGEQNRPFFRGRLGSYCRVRLNRNGTKMALIGATFSTLKTWGRKNQMFLGISISTPMRIFLASTSASKNWSINGFKCRLLRLPLSMQINSFLSRSL